MILSIEGIVGMGEISCLLRLTIHNDSSIERVTFAPPSFSQRWKENTLEFFNFDIDTVVTLYFTMGV